MPPRNGSTPRSLAKRAPATAPPRRASRPSLPVAADPDAGAAHAHHAAVVGELDRLAGEEAAAVDVDALEAAHVHADEEPVEVAVRVLALRIRASAGLAGAGHHPDRLDRAR